MKALTFLKAINSPFKPFKLKWYIGKVAIGTPYFYPRKWVEATPKLAKKATLEYIKKEEEYFGHDIVSLDELTEDELEELEII